MQGGEGGGGVEVEVQVQRRGLGELSDAAGGTGDEEIWRGLGGPMAGEFGSTVMQ